MKKLNLVGPFQSDWLSKHHLKMKLTTLLLIVSLFKIQANTYGQNTKITLNLSNVSVQQVFEEIESLSDFRFLYNHEKVNLKRTVSVNVNKEPISNILDRIFEATDVYFTVKNKQIILKTGKLDNSVVPVETTIDQHSVSGTISDADGNPLPGANIVEKGTTNGVTADFDGNFTLDVANENATLVVSYIGFASKEVALNGQTSISVSLEESAAGLDEVVLIGYGTQKKSDVSGSVSSIKAEDINNVVTGNATQALVGRAPGVRVEVNGGSPGAGTNIIIRGTGSLSNQDPLYVIDGVFSDNMNFLNPSDVESIEVLKDATASIYGARSGQGVILVTTKKGKSGQELKIDMDASLGSAKVIRTIDMLNATDYILNREQAYDNDNNSVPSNFYDFDPSINSDIQNASLRTAMVQNYGIRLNGGGERSTYSISANRLQQEGIVQASQFERTSLRINTSTEKGRFKFNQSLFLATSTDNPNTDFGREYGHLPISPIRSDVNDGGYAAANTGVAGITRSTNYLGIAKLKDRRNTNYNVLGNISGEFEILDGLKYKLNLSINYNNSRNFQFVPTYFMGNSDAGQNQIADLSDNRATFVSTIVENLLTYTKSIGEHNFDLLAGYSVQKDKTETIGVTVENFLSNDTHTIDAGSDIVNRTGRLLPRNIISTFGRLNYNFAGKYLLSGTIRRDGSSNFGAKNRFGVFPSVSAGWNISRESFFDVEFVDNLKLRGSWGKLGSDNLSPFQYVTALNITSEYTLGTAQERLSGVSQIQFSNPDLKWEETTTTDVGIEGSLLRGKIDFTIDYFQKTSEDILANLPVNPSSGTNVSIPFNSASVENNGIELSVTYKNTINDLNYAVTGNFGSINNEVTGLGEGVNPITGGGFTDESFNSTRTEVGYPVGYFYGYKTNGVYQNQAEIDADGLIGRSAVPGDLRYVDVNPDGILDITDKTFLGSSIPNFEYSFNLSMDYKGFDASLFFQGLEGNEIFNGKLFEGVFAQNGAKFAVAGDAWTPNNPTNIPRATVADPAVNRQTSDFYIEDGSYFRLKNISLGYTFPSSLIDKMFLTKLRTYINVENAFTIDNYSGYYPEIGRNIRRGNNLFNRGVDENAYPMPRTITVGVQVSL